MSRQRTTAIERLLQRIEERVEQWRQEHQARFVEVEAERDELWAETTEREKLLAEAIDRGEAEGISAVESGRQEPAIFVVHSGETARKLESLAAKGARLSSVVPGNHSPGRESGLEGTWLVFEGGDKANPEGR